MREALSAAVGPWRCRGARCLTSLSSNWLPAFLSLISVPKNNNTVLSTLSPVPTADFIRKSALGSCTRDKMAKEMPFTVSPSDNLTFKIRPESKGVQVKMALTNTCADVLAYKVKTTHPERYLVKPNQVRLARESPPRRRAARRPGSRPRARPRLPGRLASGAAERAVVAALASPANALQPPQYTAGQQGWRAARPLLPRLTFPPLCRASSDQAGQRWTLLLCWWRKTVRRCGGI
jgi:hypothetical protein